MIPPAVESQGGESTVREQPRLIQLSCFCVAHTRDPQHRDASDLFASSVNRTKRGAHSSAKGQGSQLGMSKS